MMKSNINELGFLSSNSYWGRGIIIGDHSGKVAVAYFIMGRSENSRNRYFYAEGDRIAIAPYDAEKLEDPSLIIYYPIKTAGDELIVTNGDQTDTIEQYLSEGRTFEDALRTRKFEPDAPHFTPRISGMVNCKTGCFSLSILKNADGKGEECARYFYEYPVIADSGRFIHTYERNDNPLPTFEGEPWQVLLDEDIDEMTDIIWTALDNDNKISLCTMMIDKETGAREVRIKNKRMGD